MDRIKEGEVKEVKIILKADVQGSVEALSNALTNLSTQQVGVNVIQSGVGGITESDVTLAKASSAVVLGFNVRPAGKAQQLSDQEGVEIKLYQVIYDAIDDVKKAMVGMLAPVKRGEDHRAGRRCARCSTSPRPVRWPARRCWTGS
jgi:translation initiation factor IF-2